MPTPAYTDYHPRWLRRHVSTYWWLEKGAYAAFILREMSCVFVGWFVVFLVMLVRAVGAGPAPYQDFLAWSASPAILLLNVVSLAFIVFHAVTFFQAAPQALVVHVGAKRVPTHFVSAAHYGALIAASVIVWWLVAGA